MSTTTRETKRWTRQEYHSAASAGVFAGEHVELIRGEILMMSPMDAKHAAAIRFAQAALQPATTDRCVLSIQLPLALGPASEPEPDLSVVLGVPADFIDEHPRTAALVVEVSSTTLTFDQTTKRSLYAEHQIPEYWIVNLRDRQLEVYREPADADYQQVTVYSAEQHITPLVFPDRSIPVSSLLP